MAEDFLEQFTKWQLYVHYILLTLILIIYMNFAGIRYFNDYKGALQLLMIVFLGDILIHFTFWNLPKKYAWKS